MAKVLAAKEEGKEEQKGSLNSGRRLIKFHKTPQKVENRNFTSTSLLRVMGGL